MIKQGSGGSILCFVNGKIIASVAVTKKKPVNYYFTLSQCIFIDALRTGKWSIHTAGYEILKILHHRKYYNKKYVSGDDNENIILMAFVLHKLKLWELDDGQTGLFIAPRKRRHIARQSP